MKEPLVLQARTRTSQGASALHPTCALASSSFLPVLTWLPAIEFGFLLHTPHSLLCLFQFYTLLFLLPLDILGSQDPALTFETKH